jgi:(p)ppGpp synthase/HD superfamily hydrolase
MDALILKAREFAREAHKAQHRRYTGGPYFEHLEEVATIVAGARIGMDFAAVAAAWLHDVIEDQGVSPQLLQREFGSTVADLVVALTDTPAVAGINRAQRKAADRERLSKASMAAQSIKCADLISNTSTIVKYDPGFAKVYLPEKRAILEVLTRAHPGLLHYARKSLENAERELAAMT